LNRTSVRFGKVQVRTEVQNRTPATLHGKRLNFFHNNDRTEHRTSMVVI
jgi:hypothetical protein